MGGLEGGSWGKEDGFDGPYIPYDGPMAGKVMTPRERYMASQKDSKRRWLPK